MPASVPAKFLRLVLAGDVVGPALVETAERRIVAEAADPDAPGARVSHETAAGLMELGASAAGDPRFGLHRRTRRAVRGRTSSMPPARRRDHR